MLYRIFILFVLRLTIEPKIHLACSITSLFCCQHILYAMIIKRYIFFLLVFIIALAPYLAVRLIWISSAKKTNGIVAFTGKDISTQMPHSYSVIMFSATGKDTVFFNSGDNEIYEVGSTVPILYQPAEPKSAYINGFMGLWLDVTIYSIIMLVLVGIIFLHPAIVPYRSNIKIQRQKPVISVV